MMAPTSLYCNKVILADELAGDGVLRVVVPARRATENQRAALHPDLQQCVHVEHDSLEVLQDELPLIDVAGLYGNDRVEGSGSRD
jgi:hypothetical protein